MHHEPVDAKRNAEEEPRGPTGRRGRVRGKGPRLRARALAGRPRRDATTEHDAEALADARARRATTETTEVDEVDEALDQLAAMALDPARRGDEWTPTICPTATATLGGLDPASLEPFDQDASAWSGSRPPW